MVVNKGLASGCGRAFVAQKRRASDHRMRHPSAQKNGKASIELWIAMAGTISRSPKSTAFSGCGGGRNESFFAAIPRLGMRKSFSYSHSRLLLQHIGYHS